jgi:hypothetical protein
MPVELRQGEDKLVEVPVTDSTGAAVDLTSATEIIAILKIGNVEAARFSLQERPGYGTLDVAGAGNNIVRLQVKRATSRNFKTGLLSVAIAYELPDEVLDEKVTEFNTANNFGVVSTGFTKDETL